MSLIQFLSSLPRFSPDLPHPLTALLSFWTVCLRDPPPPSSVCVCRCETQGQTDNISLNLSSNPFTVCSFTSALFVFIFPSFYLFSHPSLPHRFRVCLVITALIILHCTVSFSLSRDHISAVRPTQDTHSHPPVAPPPVFHFSTHAPSHIATRIE